MSKRWSKLQKRIYNIVNPNISFQIHYAIYEMNSNNGYHGNDLPRCWITIGKKIVFDYPKMYEPKDGYVWNGVIINISESLENYLNASKDMLLEPIEGDLTGITKIISLCDRRVGKRKLRLLYDVVKDENQRYIIEKRLSN